MLVDLRAKNITGKAAERRSARRYHREQNAIPNDPESRSSRARAVSAAGHDVRAASAKGSGQVGNLIAGLARQPRNAAPIERVRAQVAEMTKRFRFYR